MTMRLTTTTTTTWMLTQMRITLPRVPANVSKFIHVAVKDPHSGSGILTGFPFDRRREEYSDARLVHYTRQAVCFQPSREPSHPDIQPSCSTARVLREHAHSSIPSSCSTAWT
ncbi:hypothetical protein BDV98DRAFT_288357 [Pterulicium gracile]|uniref:Uncharacterized protein n=1 Tax=Pterulicium gracile TaxID=1884261 RepID=A0A5C3QWP8_9AGAR|nr:hypothetical protein BDV98DRAFT_288357 [Pterula gracilis]